MSSPPSAFALDGFGFGVYTFPPEAVGALSFDDPLEGTETNKETGSSTPFKPAARARSISCIGLILGRPDAGWRPMLKTVPYTARPMRMMIFLSQARFRKHQVASHSENSLDQPFFPVA